MPNSLIEIAFLPDEMANLELAMKRVAEELEQHDVLYMPAAAGRGELDIRLPVGLFRFSPENARRVAQTDPDDTANSHLFKKAVASLRDIGMDQVTWVSLRPVSLLQRRLRIGYQSALALRDQLVSSGVLVPLGVDSQGAIG